MKRIKILILIAIWDVRELSVVVSNIHEFISDKKLQGNFNNYYVRKRLNDNLISEREDEKKYYNIYKINKLRYLDEKLEKEERLRLSLLEIEKIKNDYEDYRSKSKVEFELISSSLFEMAHQFMDLKNKNEIQNSKDKKKNWLQSERLKIFPLENYK